MATPSDPFSLQAALGQEEQKPERPKLDFDFKSAMADLVQNEGLSFSQAESAITRNLAEKANFDIDAAYKEGYTNDQIQSLLTGTPERSGAGVAFESAVREGVPIAGGGLASIAAYGPLKRAVARVPFRLPAIPKIGHPYAMAASLAVGYIADKVLSGAIDKVFGEKKPVTTGNIRAEELGEFAGIGVGFIAPSRALAKKIPETFEANLGSEVVYQNLNKVYQKAARKTGASPTIRVSESGKAAFEAPSLRRAPLEAAQAAVLKGTGAGLKGLEKATTATGKFLRGPFTGKGALAAELAVYPAAGLFGYAALTEDYGNPLTLAAAEGAGSMIDPRRIAINTVSSTKDGIKKVLGSRFSRTAREDKAAQYLTDMVDTLKKELDAIDPQLGKDLTNQKIIESLRSANERLDGGTIALTPAQKTGSPVFMLLENFLRTKDAGFADQSLRASERGLEAIEGLVNTLKSSGDPLALEVAATFRRNTLSEMFDAQITSALSNATRKAEDLINTGKVTDIDGLAYTDEAVFNILQETMKGARAVERKLYEPLTRSTLKLRADKTITGYYNDLGNLPSNVQRGLNSAGMKPFLQRNFSGTSLIEDLQLGRKTKAADSLIKRESQQIAQLESANEGLKENYDKFLKASAKAAGVSRKDIPQFEGSSEFQRLLNLNRSDLNLKAQYDDLLAKRYENYKGVQATKVTKKGPKSLKKYEQEDFPKYLASLENGEQLQQFGQIQKFAMPNTYSPRVLQDYGGRKKLVADAEAGKKSVKVEQAALQEAYDAPIGTEITLGELIGLRSSLLKQRRSLESGPNPDFNTSRQLGKTIKDIEDDLDAFATRADLPEESAKIMEDLKEARVYSKTFNDKFTRSFVGDSFAKKARGDLSSSPELFLENLFKGGSSNKITQRNIDVKDAINFLRYNNDAVEKARRVGLSEKDLPLELQTGTLGQHTLGAAQSNFLRELAFAGTRGGDISTAAPGSVFRTINLPTAPGGRVESVLVVDEAKRQAFFTKYQDVLGLETNNGRFVIQDPANNPFKTLIDDLNNAETKDTLLNSFGTYKEAVDSGRDIQSMENLGQYWKDLVRKEELAGFLGNENPSSVVANVFNSKSGSPVKEFKNIINQLNGLGLPEKQLINAKATLNDTIFDYLIESTKKGGVISPLAVQAKLKTPISQTGGETFESFIKNQSLAGDATEKQLSNFKKLIDEMANIELSLGRTGDVGIEALQSGDGLSPVANLFTRIVGAGLGTSAARTLGLDSTLVAGAAGSDYMRTLFGKTPNIMIQDILIDASRPTPGGNQLMASLLAKGAAQREKFNAEEVITDFIARSVGSTVFPAIGIQAITSDPVPEPERRPVNLDNISNVPQRSANFALRNQPVAPAPRPANQSQRAQYASMFPNDITSSVIRNQPQQQGIGSLME